MYRKKRGMSQALLLLEHVRLMLDANVHTLTQSNPAHLPEIHLHWLCWDLWRNAEHRGSVPSVDLIPRWSLGEKSQRDAVG